MPTCCRVPPTSQPRCPSCSPSTSKLCCAFSPFPWLLTSRPCPGGGFCLSETVLSVRSCPQQLSQGKSLGCRNSKFSCRSTKFQSSHCPGGTFWGAALQCLSSTPTGTAGKGSHSQDVFAVLSVPPCPQHTPSQCSQQGALQST